MTKSLYITEKPSVADSFAGVLGIEIIKSDRGRGYAENENAIISWCYGHLVTMAYPEAYDPAYKAWRVEHLPIIPAEYKYEIINNAGVKKQFEVIKKLMHRNDVSMIYFCTDSGREGEYIFRLVYQESKSNKPAKCVWISSQTEEAVRKGIKEAKTVDQPGEGERYYSKEEARAIIDMLNGYEATVKKVEIKIRKEAPRLLFNLAELQSEANKKYKLPVGKTLEIAQRLYEKKTNILPANRLKPAA